MVLDSYQLQDVNRLKAAVIELKQNRWLPNAATKNLNHLLKDDTIDAEKFYTELKKLVQSTEGLSWDRVWSKVQAPIEQFSGIQFFGVLLIFVLIFVFRQSLFSTKTKTKGQLVFQDLGKRIVSVLAYFFFIVSFLATYERFLDKNYSIALKFVPSLVFSCVNFYRGINPYYITISYLILIYSFVKRGLPKPRIVRFHIIQGFVLHIFQAYPTVLFSLILQPLVAENVSESLTQGFTSVAVLINLYLFFPAIYQAATLNYPKNKFLREAIEIHVGRDEEGPDGTPFKWWDRQ